MGLSETVAQSKEDYCKKEDFSRSKPRLHSLDGLRFLVVLPIVLGHFLRFGTKSQKALKLGTQENILIGALFVLSGYLSAYSTTNVGEHSIDESKLVPPERFFWKQIMSYYPLHFVVSTIFAPMFISVDRLFNSPWKTNAVMNYSMMQAWFPASAKIWNPPTWIYSSLTFANVTLPSVVLPHLVKLSKDGLTKAVVSLNMFSMLQKVSYSQAWKFSRSEGQTPELWNTTRFHPLWALIEVLMGVCAARIVMLDDKAEKEKPANPMLFAAAVGAPLALRLTSVDLNDAMVRSCMFIPLFTKFVTALHRDSLSDRPAAITRFLGSNLMTYLGAVAFPMYLLHGPIGQLFYKKLVAKQLWGRVMPQSFFPVYLAIVFVASVAVNEGFVKNAAVKRLCTRLTDWLVDRSSFLQDIDKEC